MVSASFLGNNHTKKAPSLLIKPVITSGFLLNNAFTAILATASGVIFTFSAVLSAFGPTSALLAKLVSVEPGLTAVTDTPVFLSSCLRPLLKFNIKALEAAYADKPGTAW